MAIRVLVADDQETVRTGFRMIVDSRPDVCPSDIRMPVLDGLAATRAPAGVHREPPARNRVETAAWAWEPGLVT
ncbi:hypothetical protein [Actinomadura sp. GTD37]|uniref:hypothetical protein n=1 Tax=Actinomadura sp. GTD37 TaxID=1778030 RepID=UPI0035C1E8DC